MNVKAVKDTVGYLCDDFSFAMSQLLPLSIDFIDKLFKSIVFGRIDCFSVFIQLNFCFFLVDVHDHQFLLVDVI